MNADKDNLAMIPPQAPVRDADRTALVSDEMILHRWDTHVGYESFPGMGYTLTDKDKIAFARAVLYEALSALPSPPAGEQKDSQWKPVESAPKDGTRFLAWVDGAARVVMWGKTSHVPIHGFCLADQGWEDFDLCEFFYWMPLPPAPGGTA
jgi:hypothetical protein